MESRRQSFCDRFNQYVYSSVKYIKYKIIIPISHHKSWTLQAVAFLGTMGYFGISKGQEVQHDTHNIAYSIARSNAMMLKIAMPAVILPTLVTFASLLQRSGFGKYLAINNRIISHKLIASIITGLSISHSIAHYFYNKDNFKKQPGITGIVMLGCLAIPLGGVYFIRWLKPKSTHSFGLSVKRPHQLGSAIFITLFGVHTSDLRLLPFTIAIAGTWILDRCYEYFSYRHAVVLKSISRIDNTNYLLLRLTIPPHLNLYNYLPGQYVELAVSHPNLNRFLEAPHPFTIVTIDKNSQEIYLAIKQLGEWTTKLGNLAKQKNIPATLWGPYGSPLNSFYKHSQMAIITAGIGMTPFLAYVFWLVERRQTSPVISLDIALAKIEEVFLWLKALNHPNLKRINFIDSVNIYISQQKIYEIKKGLAKMKYLSHLNFIYPEEKQDTLEIKVEKNEEENSHLLEHLDDDFFVNFNDPELMNESMQDVDQQEQMELKENKYDTVKETRLSPLMLQTPVQHYPALNATGLLSSKEQRKKLDIRIFTRRLNINDIFSHTLFSKAAVCAGDQMTKEVTKSAMDHGIKLYKESF